MSSGESTNVLANDVGRIDFRAKRPQFVETSKTEAAISSGRTTGSDL